MLFACDSAPFFVLLCKIAWAKNGAALLWCGLASFGLTGAKTASSWAGVWGISKVPNFLPAKILNRQKTLLPLQPDDGQPFWGGMSCAGGYIREGHVGLPDGGGSGQEEAGTAGECAVAGSVGRIKRAHRQALAMLCLGK